MNSPNTSQQHHAESILILPQQLKQQLPLSPQLASQVTEHRQTIQNILEGKGHRFMFVTGPCCIHDQASELDYAEDLKQLHSQKSAHFCLVRCTDIEKPRTTVGW